VIRADRIEVDLAARIVRRDGREVHLTPTEYDLLRVLVRNRGRLVTYRELLVAVWGTAYADDTQVLRAHEAKLRRKIEPEEGPRYVKTDPRIGYRFPGQQPSQDRARRATLVYLAHGRERNLDAWEHLV
jgi:two-component system, OmpR family, KDP operon response regulator KdpE